jgi:hypothetical protein
LNFSRRAHLLDAVALDQNDLFPKIPVRLLVEQVTRLHRDFGGGRRLLGAGL